MNKLLRGLILCLMLAAPCYPAQAAANVGDTLAAYSFTGLDGASVELPPTDGKFYIINLWATWCPPCRGEMPDLQAFYDKYKDSPKIGLYLINYAEDPGEVEEFLRGNNFSLPVVLDIKGVAPQMLYTNALPTTVIVDSSGKVVFRKVGAVSLRELESVAGKL